MADPETKVETPVAAATEAAAAPTEVVKSEPSPLAAADAAKHEGAEKTEPKTETNVEAKAEEAKPETKPEIKEPAAESSEKAPSEAKTEPEAKPEVKVEEPKPDTKEAQAEAPQAPPVYEALKLPETVKLDEQRVKKFDELLGKTEVTGKADHAAMTALRQELVNFHIEEVQRIANQVAQHQRDVWSRLTEQRVNELKADPQLGGNRIDTTLGNAKYALESMIPGFSKDEAKELIAVMDAGGVSHHRLMIKALNCIYELLREPEPVPGTLPLGATTSTKEPGNRGWYNTVEGVKAAS